MREGTTQAMVEGLERKRQELQRRLDASKTQAERNRLGQFATPPELAREIVKSAVLMLPPGSVIRFLEPGFGTGAFYSALLASEAAPFLESACGYEVDPYYAEQARELWKATGLELHDGDFVCSEPPRGSKKYNLVVCNPPYVRHHHLNKEQKRKLREATTRYCGFELNGLSGLYGYFLVISIAWMQEDGVGAWLIPAEFMDVNYGEALRHFLVTKVTLTRIHLFDYNEVQFGDALVTSAVVLFKNSPPSENHVVTFTCGGSLSSPKKWLGITVRELRNAPRWTNLFRKSGCSSRGDIRLGDLFTIKRGIATGCNSFFILTPEQAEAAGLPREVLVPILSNPRELPCDKIETDEQGEPLISNRRYLVSCSLSEDEVRVRFPTLWKYLQEGVKKGVHQRYLCSRRSPWFSQEKRVPAPFLCTYMGRATRERNGSPFRFILNLSRAVAPNVYLMLNFRPGLGAHLSARPELLEVVWRGLSSLRPETLVAEGRVYGGGLFKLEPKELANVPADAVVAALEAAGIRVAVPPGPLARPR